MAEDLQRFLDGQPTRLPLRRMVRAGRWLKGRAVPLGVAALLLVGLGLGGRAWWSGRPAELSFVLSELAGPRRARVQIDDVFVGEAGTTPLRVSRPPGRYRIWTQAPGFGEVAFDLAVEPGQVVIPLHLGQPRTREEEAAASRAVGLEPQVDLSIPRNSQPVPALLILAPRGDLRAADLAEGWVIDLADPGVTGGSLVLRRGAEELGRAAFTPEAVWPDHVVCGRFPPQLLAMVRPGDELSLAWEAPAGADPQLRGEAASFRLLEGDPAAAVVARIEALLAPGSEFAGRLRSAALASVGLRSASLHAALRHARAFPAAREAWVLLNRVVARIDPYALLAVELQDHVSHGHPVPALCAPGR